MISCTRLYVESTETLVDQGNKGGTVHNSRNNGPILRRFLEVYNLVKKQK